MHNPMADHPIFVIVDQLERMLRFSAHLRTTARSYINPSRGPGLRFATILFAVSFLLLLTQEALAQSRSDLINAGRSESRATLALTIPFGGNERRSEAQPRVELALTSRQYDREDEELRLRQYDHNLLDPVRLRTSVGLTFGRTQRLLLNGNSVATFGPQLYASDEEDKESGGISTGAFIGIGVAALLVGGVVFAADETRDSLRDAINPD